MKRAIMMVAALCVATMTGLAKEEKVKVSDLPVAVTKAVKAVYPEGSIKDAEKEMKDGKTVYEIDVMVGDVEYEMEITADGKVLKKATDDEDEEADDDDEEDKDDDDDDDDDD